jgi:hypothetical protein
VPGYAAFLGIAANCDFDKHAAKLFFKSILPGPVAQFLRFFFAWLNYLQCAHKLMDDCVTMLFIFCLYELISTNT